MKPTKWNPDGTYDSLIEDPEEFYKRTSEVGGAEAEALARAAVAWVQKTKGGGTTFGERGLVRGPLYLTFPDRVGDRVKVLAIDTDGGVSVNYNHLCSSAPYTDPEERIRLNRRLTAIKGISIEDDRAEGCSWPKISLETLGNEATRSAFFRVFDDVAVRLAGATAT